MIRLVFFATCCLFALVGWRLSSDAVGMFVGATFVFMVAMPAILLVFWAMAKFGGYERNQPPRTQYRELPREEDTGSRAELPPMQITNNTLEIHAAEGSTVNIGSDVAAHVALNVAMEPEQARLSDSGQWRQMQRQIEQQAPAVRVVEEEEHNVWF